MTVEHWGPEGIVQAQDDVAVINRCTNLLLTNRHHPAALPQGSELTSKLGYRTPTKSWPDAATMQGAYRACCQPSPALA